MGYRIQRQLITRVLFILSLVIHSFASSLPEILCPNGHPGITVQLAPARSDPFHPAIYSTDCSDNLINRRRKLVHKRQEYICPADAPPRCTNDSPQRPSASDCSQLLSFLNGRASQFTVQDLQTVTVDSGTCRFSLQNLVSSPFIYCDTAWASRSSSVINSCFSSNNGGFAQGSRFSAIVGYNPTYQAPAPSTPQQSANPPASSPSSTNNNNNNGSSNNGGTNNNNNNNNNSGGSSSNNAGSTQTNGGANPNPSSGSVANGSSSGDTRTGGSTSGAVLFTSVTVSGSTTLPGGSIVAATITLSSLSLPDIGGSSTNNSANENASGQGKSNTPYLIPAIVGSILGTLSILFLLLFCLWRRRKQAKLEKVAQQEQNIMIEVHNEPTEEVPYNIGSNLNVQPGPYLGGEAHESITGAAGLAKIRMAAEEARLASLERRNASGHTHNPSLENASSITGDTVLSPADSATPPYRSRSHHQRRDREARRSPSSGSSSGRHLHWRGAFASGTVATESGISLVTPSTSGSESSRRYPSTRRHRSHRRGRDDDSLGSGSISARTLAQTVAPNLSERDIDRLAESIVARIHGRDPTLAENGRYGHVGARESVLSEGEEEPPPPWSAPENNRQSLRDT